MKANEDRTKAPPVPRTRRAGRLFGIAKLGMVVAGLVGAGIFWRERPVQARAAVVDQGEVTREVTGTGTVESDEQVTLAFVASGRIASLAVDEGDRVAAGALLGAIDLADTDKQMQVARASESVAGSAIARARADVVRARVSRDAAQTDFDRMQALARTGTVAASVLDAARERLDRAEAELAGAHAAVVQAGVSVTAARETTGLYARRREDGRLVSPVDGIVLERKRVVGDVVGVGTPVLVIASTRKVRVRAWIDETLLDLLRVGGDARVRMRSVSGAPLKGRIERIGAQADRQTHEVLVDVELLERPERLAFGQRADVSLVVDRRESVPRVPAGFCDLASESCLVARAGRVQRVRATFGLVGAEAIEVTSGLSAGDELLAPMSNESPLREGRRVRRAM